MNCSLSTLEKLFDAADTDRSGFVEFDEFCQLCEGVLPTGDIRPVDIFRELDSDGDGKISRNEFLTGFSRTCRQILFRRTSTGGSFISFNNDDDFLSMRSNDKLTNGAKNTNDSLGNWKNSNEAVGGWKASDRSTRKSPSSASLNSQNSNGFSSASTNSPKPGRKNQRLPWMSQESVQDETAQNSRIFAAVSWEKFLASLGLNFYLISYTRY